MSAALLARLAAFCARHGLVVTLLGLIAIPASLGVAQRTLSLNSDFDTLFAASLPWRQRDLAMRRDFPQFTDLLVAVVDADIPEEADETAAALADALSADKAHVAAATRPDASPFFARNGLLFLDQPKLAALLDRTVDSQPFLGQLAADPSARGLLGALALLATGVEAGQADLRPFAPALAAFHAALGAAASGHAAPLSWETLLSGSLADLGGRYRFVLIRPKLDYAALQPGGAATATIRAAIARLPWVRAGAARVHVTGNPALADEEIATATGGALRGLIASTALIVLWLLLALRSWRLIIPAMATLLLGLSLTTLFAALAVGTLNLISIAFAILFVGIAVDFAIQFGVRFRALRRDHDTTQAALAATARRSGAQIGVAAGAIAAGFLAFVPTSFVGVAQLGLIAGFGMLAAFACTLTFLPAMLACCRPRAEAGEIGFAWARPLDRAVARGRWAILAGCGAALAAGLALLPGLPFDGDPLHTKNPHTEAMRTLYRMIDDPHANPYSAELLRPDPDSADALAARLRALPLAGEVITLDSFVPEGQAAKLALIADAAGILGPTLAPHAPAAPVSAADLRLAVETAFARLHQALPRLPPGDRLGPLVDDLRRLRGADDARLVAMNIALTRFLPMQLARLRDVLQAEPVTRAALPPELARDWLAPDGRIRVQAMAGPAAHDARGLRRFADQVRAIAPDAGGPVMSIVATADTVVGAFRRAAYGAILAIAVILALALRRAMDVALVLAALLMSAAMTVLCLRLSGQSLNFANVIALPLLLGVGVSFNIYFVMNWRAGEDRPLSSATARAVLFSAFTTGSAFGSLALSAHPGTASMGRLLLVSLGCTLAASFGFLPALLAALRPPITTARG